MAGDWRGKVAAAAGLGRIRVRVSGGERKGEGARVSEDGLVALLSAAGQRERGCGSDAMVCGMAPVEGLWRQ